MKYMGSKSRHWREIVSVMFKSRNEGQWYVEPFCGGMNVVCHVDGNRIASDCNRFVIAMFQAAQSGWVPPDSVNEDLYNDVRSNPHKYDDCLVGFVGVGCSYSGKFFGGYARGAGRNYCLESKNNLLRQDLSGIDIRCCDYRKLDIPPNSLIYCDPPYRGTTKYKCSFDHDEFWQWCRDKQDEGHTVFVSEYAAPDDFSCVWEKKVCSSLTKDTGSKTNTERLFTRIR
jgi:DNA adenine methylase